MLNEVQQKPLAGLACRHKILAIMTTIVTKRDPCIQPDSLLIFFIFFLVKYKVNLSLPFL